MREFFLAVIRLRQKFKFNFPRQKQKTRFTNTPTTRKHADGGRSCYINAITWIEMDTVDHRDNIQPASSMSFQDHNQDMFDDDFTKRVIAWNGFDKANMFQVQNAVVLECEEIVRSLGNIKREDQHDRLKNNYESIVNKWLLDGNITRADKEIYFDSFKSMDKEITFGHAKFGSLIAKKFGAIRPKLQVMHAKLPKDPPSGKNWFEVFEEHIHNHYIDYLLVRASEANAWVVCFVLPRLITLSPTHVIFV